MSEEHEFQFPRFHVMREFEEAGETFREAVTPPVCDFCFDTRVMWDYDCERIALEDIEFYSDNGWAACDACSTHIEKGELPMLSRRMIASWTALGKKINPGDIDKSGQIIQAFLDHRIGDRVAYG